MLRAKITFLASALAALLSGPAEAQTPAEARVLTGLNALRAGGISCPGLGRRPVAAPLRVSDEHALAARMQAGYLGGSGRITHTGANGSTPRVRAASTGVRAVSVTEIVYLGGGLNPAGAVGWWRGSAVHCAVLTDPRYTHAGAAVVQGSRGTAYVVVLSSQPR